MTSLISEKKSLLFRNTEKKSLSLSKLIDNAWSTIAPAWPINHLIATNPLQGLESHPFKVGLKEAHSLFEREDFPEPLEACNRYFMKWCQVYFDRGQATIKMPYREQGFYKAWLQLARLDSALHKRDPLKKAFIKSLSGNAKKDLIKGLDKLRIPSEKKERFLTLMLTLLSGWSSHVKYCVDWDKSEPPFSKENLQLDFLAIRVLSFFILWPEAKDLLLWDEKNKKSEVVVREQIEKIERHEKKYLSSLLPLLKHQLVKEQKPHSPPKAQFIFCIDVRSEPFRKSLESVGPYETFGFAGFFGLPIEVRELKREQAIASCPVIVDPAHTLKEELRLKKEEYKKHERTHTIHLALQKVYKSLKYTFHGPYALVETLGPFAGLSMGLKSLSPRFYSRLKKKFQKALYVQPSKILSIEVIPFEQRLSYAKGALQTLGLMDHFAPFVFLCGHGSQTENNPYQSALNCGACAGRAGKNNAQALAAILNDPAVRLGLKQEGILIPSSTQFVAAEHNTTTDELDLDLLEGANEALQAIQKDLQEARLQNNQWRAYQLGLKSDHQKIQQITEKQSGDWAQIRPEWGLAKNAAFIVGPRSLTKDLNLFGRCFLQSYDWKLDPESKILEGILGGPMKVGYWINSQYLFSSLNNSAFGSGSKITANIVGLLGVMQGNGSDLMHGLPWQSLFQKIDQPYHEPVRLSVCIYAPKDRISPLIIKNEEFSTLFKNEWLRLYALDPTDQSISLLDSDLKWRVLENV